jgi:hypothetical protein
MRTGFSPSAPTSIAPSIRQTIWRSSRERPQKVGAADPGGHLRHAHADLALLALADQLGGEAERALEHLQRGLEQVLAGLHLGEHQAAVLAQLHHASFGELHLHARAAAGEDAVARAQLHAGRERNALACRARATPASARRPPPRPTAAPKPAAQRPRGEKPATASSSKPPFLAALIRDRTADWMR